MRENMGTLEVLADIVIVLAVLAVGLGILLFPICTEHPLVILADCKIHPIKFYGVYKHTLYRRKKGIFPHRNNAARRIRNFPCNFPIRKPIINHFRMQAVPTDIRNRAFP
mgnify:CR=1 FL=1